MSKLYLDSSNIQNYVINDLDIAIENLNKAIYWPGTLKIPDDFQYAQYLKHINSKNYNSMSRLSESKNKLQKSIASYKKIEKENSNGFVEIDILNIPVRNSFNK